MQKQMMLVLPLCIQACTLYASNTNILTLSAGPAWYNAGKTQQLYIQPDFSNTYTPHKSLRALAQGEIFAGFQHAFFKHTLGQLGVAFAATSPAQLDGTVWEFNDPSFDNFIYQYHITHLHAAIKGKALSTPFFHTYQPYITGSTGVGFNHAYDYHATPQIFEVIAPPDFQSNTKVAFTYTLGIGVQHTISSHTTLGLGYTFSDWGKSALREAINQRTYNALQLDHFYTNQLEINITYLK